VEGSANAIKAAYLWSADSEDRDFRDEVWSSTTLDALDNSTVSTTLNYPGTGFRAFYIDLKYRDLYGRDYTKSTRMFVVDSDELL
jgi:PhoPQ-activated pathogenicity-related protein